LDSAGLFTGIALKPRVEVGVCSPAADSGFFPVSSTTGIACPGKSLGDRPGSASFSSSRTSATPAMITPVIKNRDWVKVFQSNNMPAPLLDYGR
jgi:hypothetical protein